jgi:hypothetical protein
MNYELQKESNLKYDKEAVPVLKYFLQEVYSYAEKAGIRNLFYNEQYIELIMAHLLGHTYNINTRGPDAYDEDGAWVEYKTINLAGKSNGSFQFHWLSNDKIEAYKKVKDVYCAIRHNIQILKIWSLPMDFIIHDLETRNTFAENNRLFLNNNGVNKRKNIDAHKSYSVSTIIELGAQLVYCSDEDK